MNINDNVEYTPEEMQIRRQALLDAFTGVDSEGEDIDDGTLPPDDGTSSDDEQLNEFSDCSMYETTDDVSKLDRLIANHGLQSPSINPYDVSGFPGSIPGISFNNCTFTFHINSSMSDLQD